MWSRCAPASGTGSLRVGCGVDGRAFMGAEGCSMGTQLAVTASNHCGILASAAGVPRIEPRWRAQPRLLMLQVAPPNTSNVHNC